MLPTSLQWHSGIKRSRLCYLKQFRENILFGTFQFTTSINKENELVNKLYSLIIVCFH